MSSTKLKRFVDIYTGNSISDGKKDEYTIQNKNTIPYISTKDIELGTNKVNYFNDMYVDIETNKNFKIANKGDILLCIEGGSAGKKIARLDYDVCFVNKLCCFKGNDKVYNDFLYYYLQSDLFLFQFNLNISGLIGGVSQSLIKEFNMPLLSKEKQIRIADYLNKRCKAIENIIDDNNKEIKLLNEYKENLITENVTKNEFRKVKLKNVCVKITDGAHISPDTNNGIYDFVSVVDLQDNGKIDFEHCLKTSLNSYEQMVKNSCNPIKGDVLISKDGSVGKTALIDYDKNFVVASSLVILRPDQRLINSKYLEYSLNSHNVKETLKSYLTGAGLKRVSIEKNKNLIIRIPNIKEQKKIIDFLDRKCLKLDKVIEYRKQIIEKLEEYKKSLIYEAVTGKIEV